MRSIRTRRLGTPTLRQHRVNVPLNTGFRGTPCVESTLFQATEENGGAGLFDFLSRERQIGSYWVVDPTKDKELKVYDMDNDEFRTIWNKDKDLNVEWYRDYVGNKNYGEFEAGRRKLLFVRPWATYRTGAGVLAAGPVGKYVIQTPRSALRAPRSALLKQSALHSPTHDFFFFSKGYFTVFRSPRSALRAPRF